LSQCLKVLSESAHLIVNCKQIIRSKVYGKNDRVKCTHCLSEFSISHGGRSDIKDHIQSAKHQANLQVAAKNVRLDSFFLKTLLDDGDLLVAAKEATFAYHSAVHNARFKSADCSSKLIAKLFEPKFRSARTKTEAIILNAIVPLAAEELKNDLKINFVTVAADASNRKDVKLIPVMVRFFWPEGVKLKFVYFHSVPGETADIIRLVHENVIPVGIPWETSHGMGWDMHKLL